jgi:magnesium-transporting ATPase (P-type)
MTLAAIVFCQIGMVFNCRTERASVFKVGIFSNRMVLIGIAVELTLLGILMYVPFMHNLFNTAPLGLRDFAFLIVLSPLILFMEELRKVILRKRDRHNSAYGKKSNQEVSS